MKSVNPIALMLLFAGGLLSAPGCEEPEPTKTPRSQAPPVPQAGASSPPGASVTGNSTSDASSRPAGDYYQAAVAGTPASAAELLEPGQIQFEFAGDQTLPVCYCRHLDIEGRPSVLQVSSYVTAEEETFPSLLLRAEIAAGSLEQVVGSPLPVQLFLQPKQGGNVWRADRNKPAALTIEVLDNGQLQARFEGVVEDVVSGARQPIRGTLAGKLNP